MSLDVPVFELKNLKRHFYFFLIINVVLTATAVLIVTLIDIKIAPAIVDALKSWGFLLIIVLFTYLYGQLRKKELQAILNNPDFEQKFPMYERYYKKKLIWSVFSQFLMDAFWIITHHKFYFYLMLLQLALLFILFPNRKLISKELKDTEIVFV